MSDDAFAARRCRSSGRLSRVRLAGLLALGGAILATGGCGPDTVQYAEALLACETAVDELPEFDRGDLVTLQAELAVAEHSFQTVLVAEGLAIGLPARKPRKLLLSVRGGTGIAFLSSHDSTRFEGSRAGDWELTAFDLPKLELPKPWRGAGAYRDALEWRLSGQGCTDGSLREIVELTLKLVYLGMATSHADADAFNVYFIADGRIALEAVKQPEHPTADRAEWLFLIEGAREGGGHVLLKLTHSVPDVAWRGLPLAPMLDAGPGSIPPWARAFQDLVLDGSNEELAEYGRQKGWQVDVHRDAAETAREPAKAER